MTAAYYAPSYWRGKYLRPYERRRAEVIQGVYRRIPFQPGWLALDLGAGTGFYAQLLAQRGACVVGADVDCSALAQGQGFLPVACDADGGRLPFRDGAFDFINALDVLEHLRRPQALLDELVRLLKPGGFALVSTQNRDSLEGAVGRCAARLQGREWKAWDETHTHIFSYAQLLAELRRRLPVVERGSYYFGMASVRAHPLPPLLWRLFTRLPGLQRLGFTMMMVARKPAP